MVTNSDLARQRESTDRRRLVLSVGASLLILWFPLPWWVCVIGYVLLIAGILGVTWAESVNRFFEPTVRIQADRGHTVIDFGPYAIVRHPGYVSGFLVFIGTPLSLGSLWALIPAVMACLLLVVRTILEDRTLRTGLTGYGEYAQRVRYRLVPGVWKGLPEGSVLERKGRTERHSREEKQIAESSDHKTRRKTPCDWLEKAETLKCHEWKDCTACALDCRAQVK